MTVLKDYRGPVAGNLVETLAACAQEIGEVVRDHQGRGLSGDRPTQYHLDVVADEVAGRVLRGAGLRVVSEESGVSGAGDLVAVVDPIDGSTNSDRGIPFFATSIAVLRDDELVVGLVRNHATGQVYVAERAGGAWCDGSRLRAGSTPAIGDAIVGVSGLPRRRPGWAQFRAMGAASLEICLVAAGALDAFSVAGGSSLHPWDYLAGLAVVREAGGFVGSWDDDELVVADDRARHPLFAGTARLAEQLRAGGPL